MIGVTDRGFRIYRAVSATLSSVDAIGLLVAAHNSLSKTGKALEVINVSDDLFGLFRTLRLDQHFIISGDGAEG